MLKGEQDRIKATLTLLLSKQINYFGVGMEVLKTLNLVSVTFLSKSGQGEERSNCWNFISSDFLYLNST